MSLFLTALKRVFVFKIFWVFVFKIFIIMALNIDVFEFALLEFVIAL